MAAAFGKGASSGEHVNSPRRALSGRPNPSRGLFGGKVDEITDENRRLKERVQQLEKQNRDLKRTVFDLNMRMSSLWSPSQSAVVFDVDRALAGEDQPGRAGNGLAAQSAGSGLPHRQRLAFHAELTGHAGAVYVVQYSPNAKLLATGSMDGTARLWNAERMSHRVAEACILAGHGSGVSDVAWSASSDRVVTASFDSTARVWDAATGSELFVYPVAGLPTSVAVAATEPSVFYCATSTRKLHVVDTRAPPPSGAAAASGGGGSGSGGGGGGSGGGGGGGGAAAASVLETDAAVSSVCVLPNGTMLTGDSRGVLKVWDIRQGQCVDDDAGGGPAAPVAHIAGLSSKHGSDAGGRYIAVNSHDNVVRLYDRGGVSKRQSLRLYASATGHTTRNWPVRCSLYRAERVVRMPAFPGAQGAVGGGFGGGEDGGPGAAPQMLVAVGSTDGEVRVFDASDTRHGVSPLVQQLSGHTGRVYGVHFHPQELALASCSQDGTVRIWTV